MPSFEVTAEPMPHEGGPCVHVWVDGKREFSLGPFSSLDEAGRAAQRMLDEVKRCAMPTINATMASDVSDEAFALMGRQ